MPTISHEAMEPAGGLSKSQIGFSCDSHRGQHESLIPTRPVNTLLVGMHEPIGTG